MENPDLLLTLDNVCQFYHKEATFPAKLTDIPADTDPNSLMRIGNLFEQQLSVSHLAKNDLVLIITDGVHGRNLVDFLYRERVFATDTSENATKPGFYYIYPRRTIARCVQHIANHHSWLPGGLPQATKKRLLETVVTLDVVTDVNFMKTTAVFLIELCNSSSSYMGLANTLIDAMVQKKVTCILSVFDNQLARSKDLPIYLGSIVSVIESGREENLHVFINFGDEELERGHAADIQRDFEAVLRDAIKDSVCDVDYASYAIQPISIPKGTKLMTHLLGVSEKQLRHLIVNMRNPDFRFQHAKDGEDGSDELPADYEMDSIVDILQKLIRHKVQFSIDRLEADIEHLYRISNRIVREDRAREITNYIASFQTQIQVVQNFVLVVVVTIAIFLQLLSLMNLDGGNQGIDMAPGQERSHWLMKVTQKYTMKHWMSFYVTVGAYYIGVKVLCDKFSATEELDSTKYQKHKTALRYLESSKAHVKQLRTSVVHQENGESALPRRRLASRRVTT